MEYDFKTMEDFPAIKSQGYDREMVVNETPYEERLTIYVSDNMLLHSFKKKILANPDEWKVEKIYKTSAGDVTGYEISCPKDFMSFKTKRKTFSDERRAALSAQMKEMRAAQLAEKN